MSVSNRRARPRSHGRAFPLMLRGEGAPAMSATVLPTTPSAPASTPPPAAGAPRPVKWTDDDFYRMEDLPSLQGLESMLLDGAIVVTPLPGPLASIAHGLAEDY